MSRVEVRTATFEFSHGKKPRGEGNWAFSFNGGTGTERVHWFSGTYGKAKKEAMAQAKAEGAWSITVLP